MLCGKYRRKLRYGCHSGMACVDGVGANNSRNVISQERQIRPRTEKSTRLRPKAISPTPTTAPIWIGIRGVSQRYKVWGLYTRPYQRNACILGNGSSKLVYPKWLQLQQQQSKQTQCKIHGGS